jgi:hypothetical protein
MFYSYKPQWSSFKLKPRYNEIHNYEVFVSHLNAPFFVKH